MFEPITTERLVIRAMAADDAPGLAERRSHPDVAEFQTWDTPVSLDDAQKLVESVMAMAGPENDEWWMASVCDRRTAAAVGDLAVNLTWEGKTAEVGYNFDPDHWGKGLAVEALDALVDYLFDGVGVTRVFGMLHPGNIASAQLLERTGFLFEGHTRSSFWKDDDLSDDWIYGVTRQDRDRWRARPAASPDTVDLVEITAENLDAVYALATHRSQERFVAPVARSMAQALLPPERDGRRVVPWMRAVVADEAAAGFLMVALDDDAEPDLFLWRMLIDREHQRRGIGVRALDLLVSEARSRDVPGIRVGFRRGRGSPEPFYLRYGFELTGRELSEGEVEARLAL